MHQRRKKLSLCLAFAAVVAAGLSLADVVILNPGELRGQVGFTGKTLTQYTVQAASPDGFSSQKNFTTSPYSLIVESGHAYRPSITAYFNNPTSSQSALRVNRQQALPVDNQGPPTTADFLYATVRQVDFSVTVTGGTIADYYVYANASENSENYSAHSYRTTTAPLPTSVASWVAMVPVSQASVYGNVTVVAPDGSRMSRELGTQTVNLTSANQSVSWNIDLTAKGTLAGAIGVNPSANISQHNVYFQGVWGTTTQGISGLKSTTTNGNYSIDLPPGDYDVRMRTHFTSPSQHADTTSHRVTISQGATTTQNFTVTLGTGQVPFALGGFYTLADVTSSRMGLVRTGTSSDNSSSASLWQPSGGAFNFSLPPGGWRRDSLALSFSDSSNPQIPTNVSFNRYSHNAPPATVTAGGTTSLGPEVAVLVRSKAYFDVREASPNDPEILLSSPVVYLNGTAYNPDGSGRHSWSISASGSSASKGTSALTVIAEPGTYNLQAFANVNGSHTQFANQPIRFLPPSYVEPGSDIPVTPVDNEDLKVTVVFDQVSGGGVITVVETPLGPLPPQGLKTFCDDGASAEGIECPPLYYDIDTTAQHGEATVCIRRKFKGANGLANFLRLYHYDASVPPAPGQWVELPFPAGMDAPIDCGGDLAACGCASEEACGIDYNTDPPTSVYLVCGVTSSFSPFATFAREDKFTNAVGNQVYEGPTGPPSLQTWRAREAGTYRITAKGASGAAATQLQGLSGGCGAEVVGDFTLQPGDELKILVGQKGTATTYSGGGGGGSFVVLNGTPLVIAGGGGGLRAGATVNGRDGSLTPSGVSGAVSASYTSGFILGGVNGQGGARGASYGAGGGGWLGDGASDGNYGKGGASFQNGGGGGLATSCGAPAHGGYGGGGAGNGCYGGGGGGGYSGGGSGRVGGGGGSWNAGAKPSATVTPCTESGHGWVSIGPASP